MSRDVRLYLEDIQLSCKKILRYTENLEFDAFILDDRTYDAVIRNLEIIGEAVRNVPDPIRVLQPDIDWRAIAAIRNIVAHEYFGIKDEIIWDVIRHQIQSQMQISIAAIHPVRESSCPSARNEGERSRSRRRWLSPVPGVGCGQVL